MGQHRVFVDAGDPVLIAAAAANNAAWCDAVCRTHGLAPTTTDDAWTSAARTPPLHPDAITLTPDPSIADLLACIDPSPGCSIKDSFASLDLAADGFHVLFDATWIARGSGTATPREAPRGWTVIDDAEGFARWEEAWRDHDDPPGVLRADLLDDPSIVVVALVAAGGDNVIAGAILNEAAGVVGVSNVFATPAAARGAWGGCIATAERRFPGATLVGYESGPALAAARTHGFHPLGPLRVWLHAPDAAS